MASFDISSLHASRSTRRFSFSNSPGVSASVGLAFLTLLFTGLADVVVVTLIEVRAGAVGGVAIAVVGTKAGADVGTCVEEDEETVTVGATFGVEIEETSWLFDIGIFNEK